MLGRALLHPGSKMHEPFRCETRIRLAFLNFISSPWRGQPSLRRCRIKQAVTVG